MDESVDGTALLSVLLAGAETHMSLSDLIVQYQV